jgi:hypothetical protein
MTPLTVQPALTFRRRRQRSFVELRSNRCEPRTCTSQRSFSIGQVDEIFPRENGVVAGNASESAEDAPEGAEAFVVGLQDTVERRDQLPNTLPFVRSHSPPPS